MSTVEVIGHIQGLGAKMDGMQALIQQELHATNEHLKDLNGKVATNVNRIGALELKEAQRDGAKEALRDLNAFKWKVAAGVATSLVLTICGAVYAVVA